MAVHLVTRRLEQLLRLPGIRGDDLRRGHDPDADALLAPGVDIARVFDRHARIRRVQATDVLVFQARARADEDLKEWPVVTHVCLALRHDRAVLGGGARPLLTCVCGRSLAHPLTRLIGRTTCLEALAVAGAVAL